MPVYTPTFGVNEIFSRIWDADTPQHKAASADLNRDAAQHPNSFRHRHLLRRQPPHPAILDGTPMVLRP